MCVGRACSSTRIDSHIGSSHLHWLVLTRIGSQYTRSCSDWPASHSYWLVSHSYCARMAHIGSYRTSIALVRSYWLVCVSHSFCTRIGSVTSFPHTEGTVCMHPDGVPDLLQAWRYLEWASAYRHDWTFCGDRCCRWDKVGDGGVHVEISTHACMINRKTNLLRIGTLVLARICARIG